MKKTILSLALLAGAAGAAHAQTGIKVGVKGGYNLSTFSGADSKNSKYKSGFAAGVLINFGVSDKFSVQPEFLYSQKGASFDNPSFGGVQYGGDKFKSTLGYLDIPILFRYNIGEDGKGLFIELGPQGSFVLHRRDFFETNGNKTNENTSTDGLNKALIGYVGGIGYQLTSGLQLGLRYTGDFAKVYKDAAGAPVVQNSVFQFQVGYAFGGK